MERGSSPVRAQITARSATLPFVIQALVPSSLQPPCDRTARVRRLPGSEPASGSVRPKQPSTSPRAIAGR